MGTNDAVVPLVTADTGANVAGTEVEKSVGAFDYVSDPAEFVLPEKLFINDGGSSGAIEFQPMDMVRIVVVAESEHCEEHATIPARDCRAVIKHGAGGWNGLRSEELYRIDVRRIVASANTIWPAIIFAGEDDVHLIVRYWPVVGCVKLC